MTFNTGNPIGSTDARDLSDNAENMDYLENSTTELTHPDRLGTVRKTRHGMEVEHDAQIAAHETEHDNQIAAHEVEHDNQMQAFESDFDGRLAGMAFTRVGSFTTGATLTDMRQVLVWEASQGGDGREYGWTGSFSPSGKVVIAGSNPETSGGIGAGAWVFRSDASLRSDLLSQGGAALIGTSNSETVEQRLSNQAGLISRKADSETVEQRLSNQAGLISGKADLAGSSSQQFSIADATNDTSATSLGQVKSRTKKAGLTQSISSNALTLTQAKRLFNFRSATLTDGTAVEVTPTSVLTLTVPSEATLGATSGVPADFLELLLYNGGSPVIGVVNANGGLNLDESGLISSTAISASATSASVVYSSVAVTNSPYIILNQLSVTLPTAGAWSVLPTVIPLELISAAMLVKRLQTVPVATTSGATVLLTGIPNWANKVTIEINGVSLSGISYPIVQLGTASGVETSGYVGTAYNIASDGTPGIALSESFKIYDNSVSASNASTGLITLVKVGLTWFCQGVLSNSPTFETRLVSGSKTLAGVLDRIKISSFNGTDTFDAGSVSLLIEG